jgi:hypothetical protein
VHPGEGEIAVSDPVNRKPLIVLREIFTTSFSDGELRTLCFDLGIGYEDLPGEAKADKARELVIYCEQRNCIADLVYTGRRLRPDVSWERADHLDPTQIIDPQDIQDHKALLQIHRRKLAKLLHQQAHLESPAALPPDLLHAIEQVRIDIRQVKHDLRHWGHPVPDHRDDEAVAPPTVDVTLPERTLEQVRTGLHALSEVVAGLALMPDVRDAIAVYQTSFEEYRRQIGILSDYKMLHDLFQQLDDRYAVVVSYCRRLPDDPIAWEDIEFNEPGLYVKIDELLTYAGRTACADETIIWTTRLKRAQSAIRTALESYDTEEIKKAVDRLKPLIGEQLVWTDSSLKEAAKSLRLSRLVVALVKIQEHLLPFVPEKVAPQQLAAFHQGVEALVTLDAQLTRSITLHTKFQRFDDELRRIAGLLPRDVNELLTSWQDVADIMRMLCDDTTAEWKTKLLLLGEAVDHAIDSGDSVILRRAFTRYRSQATQSFNQVDYDLLHLCGKLQHIGAPLDGVLRMMQVSSR